MSLYSIGFSNTGNTLRRFSGTPKVGVKLIKRFAIILKVFTFGFVNAEKKIVPYALKTANYLDCAYG